MSCGQIALERAGFEIEEYYASEVDKHAIAVTQWNYPFTTQVGDVTKIKYANGTLHDSTGYAHKVDNIDILMGGSPCQNFSFAGTRKGMVTKDNIEILSLDQYLELKSAGFEFQGQSFLFWEYVRSLKEIQSQNPGVKFLLENVKMAKKWENLITSIIGVEPIFINSSLVSAQSRQRLYWTNIPNVVQPKDKGILLKDIIDYSVPFERTFTPKDATEKSKDGLIMAGEADDINGHDILKRIYSLEGKSPTLTAAKGGNQEVKIAKPINLGNVNPSGRGQNGNVYSVDGKSPCLTTNKGEGVKVANHIVGGAIRGRYLVDGKRQDHKMKTAGLTTQRVELREDGKTNCLTTVQKDTVVVDKSKWMWRKLTPVECERLQTVPEGYTDSVSNSQRYRMLGNGWTVDVIAHIFSFMKF